MEAITQMIPSIRDHQIELGLVGGLGRIDKLNREAQGP
jgi:hypothetical protein